MSDDAVIQGHDVQVNLTQAPDKWRFAVDGLQLDHVRNVQISHSEPGDLVVVTVTFSARVVRGFEDNGQS